MQGKERLGAPFNLSINPSCHSEAHPKGTCFTAHRARKNPFPFSCLWRPLFFQQRRKRNAAKNYVFGFPRRDMVVMCSLLRTSRNRYLRTRTLSRIVLLLFPQASRCCLYREAAFLFYRLAARRCRADGTSGRRPLRAVYRARPVGRDPCVPPHDMHVFRRGTQAPPYRIAAPPR